MAQLVLENMEFYAYHGHYAEENKIGGRFRVDVVIETDITKASTSDELSDALDYSRVYDMVKREMNQVSRLVEHVTSRIANAIHSELGQAGKVTVTVSKLNPQVGGSIGRFSVTITK
jgi:7,8-dihydroneopterin aldolase/epimerase/oxygenase